VRENARRDWFGLGDFEPGAGFDGGRLYLLDSVGSTSDFLLAREGPASGRLCRRDDWGWQSSPFGRQLPPPRPVPPLVVAARRQTRGRGRHGRRWLDLGGLHISWVLPLRQPEPPRSGLAVWTGLVAALALSELCGVRFDLRWPNDLLLSGRKIGGLIVDVAAKEPHHAVAGLGLNIDARAAQLPPELRSSTTTLRIETGHRWRPGVLAAAVLARVTDELPRLVEKGWSVFAEAFCRHDWLRGQRIALDMAQGTIEGMAAGIVEGGGLLLESASGRRRVLDGEVRLLRTVGQDPSR
jgi:BirA family biotin operon repressor/biotin-[acetyl-CoA-carboxylase] ligase